MEVVKIIPELDMAKECLNSWEKPPHDDTHLANAILSIIDYLQRISIKETK